MTAYYNKKVDIKYLDRQIKKSKVWINKNDLDYDLNEQLPIAIKINNFDNLYILFYNKETKQYNTKIEASVKNSICLL